MVTITNTVKILYYPLVYNPLKKATNFCITPGGYTRIFTVVYVYQMHAFLRMYEITHTVKPRVTSLEYSPA